MPWADARIVLTSTQPRSEGLDHALEQLGPGIAAGVIGFTFEGPTMHAAVPPRQKPIDDEALLWAADERHGHLVATNGWLGLMESAAQGRLATVLPGNFGLGKGGGA